MPNFDFAFGISGTGNGLRYDCTAGELPRVFETLIDLGRTFQQFPLEAPTLIVQAKPLQLDPEGPVELYNLVSLSVPCREPTHNRDGAFLAVFLIFRNQLLNRKPGSTEVISQMCQLLFGALDEAKANYTVVVPETNTRKLTATSFAISKDAGSFFHECAELWRQKKSFTPAARGEQTFAYEGTTRQYLVDQNQYLDLYQHQVSGTENPDLVLEFGAQKFLETVLGTPLTYSGSNNKITQLVLTRSNSSSNRVVTRQQLEQLAAESLADYSSFVEKRFVDYEHALAAQEQEHQEQIRLRQEKTKDILQQTYQQFKQLQAQKQQLAALVQAHKLEHKTTLANLKADFSAALTQQAQDFADYQTSWANHVQLWGEKAQAALCLTQEVWTSGVLSWMKKLQDESTNLNHAIRGLDISIYSLGNSVASLKNQLSDEKKLLAEEKLLLESDLSKNKQELQKSKEEYETLYFEGVVFAKEYKACREERDELKSERDELKSERDKLQHELKELKEQYQKAQEALTKEKKSIIERLFSSSKSSSEDTAKSPPGETSPVSDASVTNTPVSATPDPATSAASPPSATPPAATASASPPAATTSANTPTAPASANPASAIPAATPPTTTASANPPTAPASANPAATPASAIPEPTSPQDDRRQTIFDSQDNSYGEGEPTEFSSGYTETVFSETNTSHELHDQASSFYQREQLEDSTDSSGDGIPANPLPTHPSPGSVVHPNVPLAPNGSPDSDTEDLGNENSVLANHHVNSSVDTRHVNPQQPPVSQPGSMHRNHNFLGNANNGFAQSGQQQGAAGAQNREVANAHPHSASTLASAGSNSYTPGGTHEQ